ncbi:MAG: magnesium/cobalt transporter CorA [Psychroflexus sp.]|nr:magnesium/cobalt transporter CorA [Psychroflexus sp.]
MKRKNKSRISSLHFKTKKQVKNEMPGEIRYIGEQSQVKTEIDMVSYNTEMYNARTQVSLQKTHQIVTDTPNQIHWITFTGLTDVAKLQEIGRLFSIHPLVLEDIANTKQRPRYDEFSSYVFLTLKMIYAADRFVKEHYALILGKNFVISFQENKEDDILNFLHQRIETKKGLIRDSGSDYLFYAITDAIIDNYYNISEAIELQTEMLEDNILSFPDKASPEEIQALKRQILRVRKSVAPTKEIINRLHNSEHKLFSSSTKRFLADLYDHILQVNENIGIYREIVWGLMDMYMSSISNKMNEVMKVLTIMSTIFIPLTFIVGVYGMNFENMPELEVKYAYFYVLLVMLLISIALIIYFKKKRWF